MVGHCREYSAVGHGRDTWWLGTAGMLGVRALQGYLVVGHCRDTLRLGTSVKHFRDTHWLGTAGILGGWALQGYSAVGHCRDTWWLVTKISFQSGEDNMYFKIEQPHCEGGEQDTARVVLLMCKSTLILSTHPTP